MFFYKFKINTLADFDKLKEFKIKNSKMLLNIYEIRETGIYAVLCCRESKFDSKIRKEILITLIDILETEVTLEEVKEITFSDYVCQLREEDRVGKIFESYKILRKMTKNNYNFEYIIDCKKRYEDMFFDNAYLINEGFKSEIFNLFYQKSQFNKIQRRNYIISGYNHVYSRKICEKLITAIYSVDNNQSGRYAVLDFNMECISKKELESLYFIMLKGVVVIYLDDKMNLYDIIENAYTFRNKVYTIFICK